MSDEILEFVFKDLPVGVTTIDDEVQFIAKEVCDVLGLENVSRAVEELEDDEKCKMLCDLTISNVTSRARKTQEMWFVNESGVYNLIFKSRKPEAKVFRKWVTSEVLPTLRKTGHYETPAYKARMLANADAVPHGCFSILQELYNVLVYRTEAKGVVIPEDMLPDGSVGRMFCKHLRDECGVNTDHLPTYKHIYPDGRIVYPKAYFNDLLPEFREFMDMWKEKHLEKYFKSRMPEVIPLLEVK